jgi:two-component system sensor histidine kinase/response regulator
MPQSDSSPRADNHAPVGDARLTIKLNGLAVPRVAAPVTLSLLALLFLGAWWLGGVAGPWDPVLWMSLTMASTFAAGYLALTRQGGRQSRYIGQLEQAQERLQAELAEHARSSQLAQQAAEENRKTIWKVFKASPDPMAVLDGGPNGIFLVVNQAFTAIFGYPRDEILGKTPIQLNLPANPENLADFSRRLEPDGYVPNAETAFRTKDGRVIWGLLSAVTVDVAGKPYVSWIVRDITDRKRIEAELIAAREAAEAASRAKSEFLSSMSHEIRTPMNAVLGMAQLLAETELSEDQRHYLDLMVANGNSLLDLINSILDLAKIESGRMQVEHSEFDLTELVDKTMATFGVRAHSKGLELVAQVAPEVPERLVGDPLRLRQILTNLLGNAIKFTDSGEIVLEVEQFARSGDSLQIKFTIADTGIGIPPDKLDSIFLNFTQADSSTTRKYGGSGLGLAIAHRLVALMGGQMSVESEPGKGSRFSFTARFGQAPAASAAAVETAPSLAGYRVLIADDSRTNRMAMREMLAETGAEIDDAMNGNSAFNSIRQAAEEGRPYDFVLLDMGMPSVDGFEVVRRLRNHRLPLKSLLPMLSSDELKPQITRLQQLGLGTYLIKPISRKDLLGSIRMLLHEALNGRAPVTNIRQDTQHEGLRKILVAEDSPDNRLLIAAYLRREPYQVEFAEDGRQAVEKFIANLYDLVLMDIQMPQMDGLDATRAIRRWEFEHGRVLTPIVALTAYALEEDVQRVLAAGCDLHISKPLKKQALIECLQEAMQIGVTGDGNRQSPPSPYYS